MKKRPTRTILNPWPLFCFLLLGCSSDPFIVSPFHLRGESMLRTPVEPVKGEARYRYDRTVSEKDRKQKHGHYYVFKWRRDLLHSETDPITATLEYRQASTGRKILRKTVSLSPLEDRKTEIWITGEDYLKNGRILSWKATLSQGGETLATEQSFLWD